MNNSLVRSANKNAGKVNIGIDPFHQLLFPKLAKGEFDEHKLLRNSPKSKYRMLATVEIGKTFFRQSSDR